MIRVTGSIFFGLVFTAAAAAQNPGVELKLESTVMETGEAIGAQLICTNLDAPGTPQTAVVPGVDLRLVSARPSVLTQQSWINGAQSQSTTYTYELELKATKPGRYSVGPVSVTSGGKTYHSNLVNIVVRRPSETQGSRGDQFLFVEIDAEPRSLFVTESFKAKLTIGVRNVVINGRQIDMDLLRIIDVRRSDLSVFASSRFSQGSARLADSSGGRHLYTIYRTEMPLRAEQVGTMTVGPVFLKADYPTEVRKSFFDYRVSRSRRETARADAITIQVGGPPIEGRPESFTGAIGHYRMTVTAKPERVAQGQPVTLTVSIKGSPLEGVAAPNLAAHPELASRFDYAREEIVGDMEDGAKSFRLAVFPKQQGQQTIPPIEWTYFDPESKRYVTLASNPVVLTVDPPPESTAVISLRTEENGTDHKPSLTLLKGGISPNYVDPALVLADQSVSFGPSWTAALIVPPLAWIAVAGWSRRRDKLRADSGLARRRRAQGRASSRLREAQQHSDPASQWGFLADALTGFLSDHFNMRQESLTPTETEALLRKKGVEPALIRELISFLETADAAQYAPNMLNAASTGQTAQNIQRWIKVLERVA